MKHLVITLLILAAANSTPAADDQPGEFRTALNFDVAVEGTAVSARYLVKPKLAMLFSVGYSTGEVSSVASSAPTSTQNTDFVEFGLGLRRYLRTDEFRPLVEVEARYTKINTSLCSNRLDGFSVLGAAGIEYFLTRRFSIEGTVGATYGRREFGCTAPGGPDSSVEFDGFNTVRSAVGVNFHF